MPLDLCDIYGGGCHGCLMARDPYCGWDQGHCVSIFSSQRYVGWEPFSLGEGGHRGGSDVNRLQEESVLGTEPFWPDPPLGRRCGGYWVRDKDGEGPGVWPPVCLASLFPTPGQCCSLLIQMSHTKSAPAQSQVPDLALPRAPVQ